MAITAALIGGAATLGAAGMGLARSGSGGAAQGISEAELQANKDALVQQLQQQALVNRRAVAGTQDAFGTTVKYDPYTNTWITDEGALPKAADTAALQAGITRNTTDLQQQELVNLLAMQRAAQAGPAADAAIRELSAFRPMRQDELAGLLTQQSTDAARASYDPLRADVLRSVARTGSAAGPVLAQLGKSEADNLRQSLRENLITAMTQTEGINQQRRQGLQSAATTAAGLATPQIGQTQIQSVNSPALSQLGQQRAIYAGGATPKGNTGMGDLNSAYAALAGKQGDPNFGLNQAQTGLKELGSAFKEGGVGSTLLQKLFGGSSSSTGGEGDLANYGLSNTGTWADSNADLIYNPNQQGYTDTTSSWY